MIGSNIVGDDDAGADGSVRWQTPLDPTEPVESVVVGEQVAVSLVTAPCCLEDELAGTRVVATNVSDGAIAWESSGLWPQFVFGDTVLGIDTPRLDALDPLDPKVEGESTVVALDARTGAKNWDLSDRYASPLSSILVLPCGV